MQSKKVLPALVTLAAAGLLAGCSGSANSGTATSGAAGNGAAYGAGAANQANPANAAAPSAPSNASEPHSAAGSKAAGTGQSVSAQVANGAAIEYTADLTVRAGHVTGAADTAVQIVQSAAGYVSGETLPSAAGMPANLQLKIPVSVYPATLSRLAGVGTRLSETQQAQDVTEQVADVTSQVTSDQAAIVQLRALLTHAGSVGDLLTVQNQINSEESTLETIQAQQRALAGQTDYATVSMTIVGPKAKAAPVKHAKAAPPPGLTRGLSAGWHALRVTVDWTLALAGAVGPFAVIAALILLAAYRGRRWLLRRRAAAAAPATEG